MGRLDLLEGRHGKALLPIGEAIVRSPKVMAGIQGAQLLQAVIRDRTAPVGGAVHRSVVDDHERAVCAQPDIHFQDVGPRAGGRRECRQGGLGSQHAATAVRDVSGGGPEEVMSRPRGPVARHGDQQSVTDGQDRDRAGEEENDASQPEVHGIGVRSW